MTLMMTMLQVILLSVLGLIVVLVAVVIMLRSIADMLMYQQPDTGWHRGGVDSEQ